MLKVYVYQGPGMYIGSTVVCFDKNKRAAKKTIKTALEEMGLTSEATELTASKIWEGNIEEGGVVFEANGDY